MVYKSCSHEQMTVQEILLSKINSPYFSNNNNFQFKRFLLEDNLIRQIEEITCKILKQNIIEKNLFGQTNDKRIIFQKNHFDTVLYVAEIVQNFESRTKIKNNVFNNKYTFEKDINGSITCDGSKFFDD